MPSVVITSDNAPSTSFEITQERTVFGRGKENPCVLLDGTVSKQHFAIESILGDYFIYDLGSRNGTLLNKKQLVGKHLIKHNDAISVGHTQIVFIHQPSNAATLELEARSQLDNLRPMIKLLTGANAGFEYPISQVLTTLGKRNQQVAILQQRSTGLFISHLEGVSTLLNGSPIGRNSVKLASGDTIDICDIQMSISFKDASNDITFT